MLVASSEKRHTLQRINFNPKFFIPVFDTRTFVNFVHVVHLGNGAYHLAATTGVTPIIPFKSRLLIWCLGPHVCEPFYKHGLTLIPAWISNLTHYKVWYEITYPIPNFNGATVEVWEWISNFTQHFTGHVIAYPFWDWSSTMLVKGVTDVWMTCNYMNETTRFVCMLTVPLF